MLNEFLPVFSNTYDSLCPIIFGKKNKQLSDAKVIKQPPIEYRLYASTPKHKQTKPKSDSQVGITILLTSTDINLIYAPMKKYIQFSHFRPFIRNVIPQQHIEAKINALTFD